MPSLVLTLAFLFVFLAGFNVWNMVSGRTSSARARLWIQLHRGVGYAFMVLFGVLCYFMLLRLKGFTHELSPRLVAHAALAWLLAALLFAKVLVACYQKGARGLLTALGIVIFVAAFTLVALNVAVGVLRSASSAEVPAGVSAAVVVVLFVPALVLFLRQRGPSPLGLEKETSPMGVSPSKPAVSGDRWQLTLVRTEAQTQDSKTLRFVLPRGQHLAARPGQFLTFEWTIDGKTVTRSYSICSSPTQTGLIEITPKRVENGYVSRFLNDRAALGLTVQARGPYGAFCFDETRHKRIVMIAGGSGITPMMAMLRYIDDRCISTPSTLIYCFRTEQEMLFRRDLGTMRVRLPNFHFVPVVSQGAADGPGWRGRLRREVLESEIDRLFETTFFLCGPPAFMQHTRALLRELAVDPERILQESFGGAVAAVPAPAPTEGRFRLTLVRSAAVYRVSPQETLLESLDKSDVLLPSGCRQGICGTCATRLLDGEVRAERAEALTDEMRAQGLILPCVSRPLGDVILDA